MSALLIELATLSLERLMQGIAEGANKDSTVDLRPGDFA